MLSWNRGAASPRAGPLESLALTAYEGMAKDFVDRTYYRGAQNEPASALPQYARQLLGLR